MLPGSGQASTLEAAGRRATPATARPRRLASRAGGAEARKEKSIEAERRGVPFLGEVPLSTAVRTGGDKGRPIVDADPQAPASQVFFEIARRVRGDEPLEAQPASPAGLLGRLLRR